MPSDWRHPGLLLYRHFGLLGEKQGDKNDVRVPAFVKQANAAWSSAEYKKLLEAIRARQQQQIAAYQGRAGWSAELLKADVHWRLAAGVSYGRLWDVGLQIHPLYGVPYLPASGIKGALRSWAAETGLNTAEELFGNTDRQAKLLLLDAFPAAGGKLIETDVLNKHHEDYYEKPDRQMKPPTDYDTPSPVKFLTIARGVRFTFGFALQPWTHDSPRPDVKQLLRDCAMFAGLGAKTTKGYGRLDLA